MNINTLVRLPDGRVGRTCWHNLDGYGIRFGEELLDPSDLPPPDAMLRGPYSCPPTPNVEFVGDDYEIVNEYEEEVVCSKCGEIDVNSGNICDVCDLVFCNECAPPEEHGCPAESPHD